MPPQPGAGPQELGPWRAPPLLVTASPVPWARRGRPRSCPGKVAREGGAARPLVRAHAMSPFLQPSHTGAAVGAAGPQGWPGLVGSLPTSSLLFPSVRPRLLSSPPLPSPHPTRSSPPLPHSGPGGTTGRERWPFWPPSALHPLPSLPSRRCSRPALAWPPCLPGPCPPDGPPGWLPVPAHSTPGEFPCPVPRGPALPAYSRAWGRSCVTERTRPLSCVSPGVGGCG